MQNFKETEGFQKLKESYGNLDKFMVLGVSGSHARGLAIDTPEHTSDVDLRGVEFNSRKEILTGNYKLLPYYDRECDVVIEPLHKYIHLLERNDINSLELLNLDEEYILHSTPAYQYLRKNSGTFLSKRIYHTYMNQCRDAVDVLLLKTKQAVNPNVTKQNVALCLLKDRLDQVIFKANELYPELKSTIRYECVGDISRPSVRAYVDTTTNGASLTELTAVLLEMREQEKSIVRAKLYREELTSYNFYKACSLVIHSLITTYKALTEYNFAVCNKDQLQLLRDIKLGKLKVAEILELYNEWSEKCKKAFLTTDLPKGVDSLKVQKLHEEIVGNQLGLNDLSNK